MSSNWSSNDWDWEADWDEDEWQEEEEWQEPPPPNINTNSNNNNFSGPAVSFNNGQSSNYGNNGNGNQNFGNNNSSSSNFVPNNGQNSGANDHSNSNQNFIPNNGNSMGSQFNQNDSNNNTNQQPNNYVGQQPMQDQQINYSHQQQQFNGNNNSNNNTHNGYSNDNNGNQQQTQQQQMQGQPIQQQDSCNNNSGNQQQVSAQPMQQQLYNSNNNNNNNNNSSGSFQFVNNSNGSGNQAGSSSNVLPGFNGLGSGQVTQQAMVMPTAQQNVPQQFNISSASSNTSNNVSSMNQQNPAQQPVSSLPSWAGHSSVLMVNGMISNNNNNNQSVPSQPPTPAVTTTSQPNGNANQINAPIGLVRVASPLSVASFPNGVQSVHSVANVQPYGMPAQQVAFGPGSVFRPFVPQQVVNQQLQQQVVQSQQPQQQIVQSQPQQQQFGPQINYQWNNNTAPNNNQFGSQQNVAGNNASGSYANSNSNGNDGSGYVNYRNGNNANSTHNNNGNGNPAQQQGAVFQPQLGFHGQVQQQWTNNQQSDNSRNGSKQQSSVVTNSQNHVGTNYDDLSRIIRDYDEKLRERDRVLEDVLQRLDTLSKTTSVAGVTIQNGSAAVLLNHRQYDIRNSRIDATRIKVCNPSLRTFQTAKISGYPTKLKASTSLSGYLTSLNAWINRAYDSTNPDKDGAYRIVSDSQEYSLVELILGGFDREDKAKLFDGLHFSESRAETWRLGNLERRILAVFGESEFRKRQSLKKVYKNTHREKGESYKDAFDRIRGRATEAGIPIENPQINVMDRVAMFTKILKKLFLRADQVNAFFYQFPDPNLANIGDYCERLDMSGDLVTVATDHPAGQVPRNKLKRYKTNHVEVAEGEQSGDAGDVEQIDVNYLQQNKSLRMKKNATERKNNQVKDSARRELAKKKYTDYIESCPEGIRCKSQSCELFHPGDRRDENGKLQRSKREFVQVSAAGLEELEAKLAQYEHGNDHFEANAGEVQSGSSMSSSSDDDASDEELRKIIHCEALNVIEINNSQEIASWFSAFRILQTLVCLTVSVLIVHFWPAVFHVHAQGLERGRVSYASTDSGFVPILEYDSGFTAELTMSKRDSLLLIDTLKKKDIPTIRRTLYASMTGFGSESTDINECVFVPCQFGAYKFTSRIIINDNAAAKCLFGLHDQQKHRFSQNVDWDVEGQKWGQVITCLSDTDRYSAWNPHFLTNKLQPIDLFSNFINNYQSRDDLPECFKKMLAVESKDSFSVERVWAAQGLTKENIHCAPGIVKPSAGIQSATSDIPLLSIDSLTDEELRYSIELMHNYLIQPGEKPMETAVLQRFDEKKLTAKQKQRLCELTRNVVERSLNKRSYSNRPASRIGTFYGDLRCWSGIDTMFPKVRVGSSFAESRLVTITVQLWVNFKSDYWQCHSFIGAPNASQTMTFLKRLDTTKKITRNLVCDRGSEFRNATVIRYLLNLLTMPWFLVAGNPRPGGKFERANEGFQWMIDRKVFKTIREALEYGHEICNAHNITPSRLLFGQYPMMLEDGKVATLYTPTAGLSEDITTDEAVAERIEAKANYDKMNADKDYNNTLDKLFEKTTGSRKELQIRRVGDMVEYNTKPKIRLPGKIMGIDNSALSRVYNIQGIGSKTTTTISEEMVRDSYDYLYHELPLLLEASDGRICFADPLMNPDVRSTLRLALANQSTCSSTAIDREVRSSINSSRGTGSSSTNNNNNNSSSTPQASSDLDRNSNSNNSSSILLPAVSGKRSRDDDFIAQSSVPTAKRLRPDSDSILHDARHDLVSNDSSHNVSSFSSTTIVCEKCGRAISIDGETVKELHDCFPEAEIECKQFHNRSCSFTDPSAQLKPTHLTEHGRRILKNQTILCGCVNMTRVSIDCSKLLALARELKVTGTKTINRSKQLWPALSSVVSSYSVQYLKEVVVSNGSTTIRSRGRDTKATELVYLVGEGIGGSFCRPAIIGNSKRSKDTVIIFRFEDYEIIDAATVNLARKMRQPQPVRLGFANSNGSQESNNISSPSLMPRVIAFVVCHFARFITAVLGHTIQVNAVPVAVSTTANSLCGSTEKPISFSNSTKPGINKPIPISQRPVLEPFQFYSDDSSHDISRYLTQLRTHGKVPDLEDRAISKAGLWPKFLLALAKELKSLQTKRGVSASISIQKVTERKYLKNKISSRLLYDLKMKRSECGRFEIVTVKVRWVPRGNEQRPLSNDEVTLELSRTSSPTLRSYHDRCIMTASSIWYDTLLLILDVSRAFQCSNPFPWELQQPCNLPRWPAEFDAEFRKAFRSIEWESNYVMPPNSFLEVVCLGPVYGTQEGPRGWFCTFDEKMIGFPTTYVSRADQPTVWLNRKPEFAFIDAEPAPFEISDVRKLLREGSDAKKLHSLLPSGKLTYEEYYAKRNDITTCTTNAVAGGHVDDIKACGSKSSLDALKSYLQNIFDLEISELPTTFTGSELKRIIDNGDNVLVLSMTEKLLAIEDFRPDTEFLMLKKGLGEVDPTLCPMDITKLKSIRGSAGYCASSLPWLFWMYHCSAKGNDQSKVYSDAMPKVNQLSKWCRQTAYEEIHFRPLPKKYRGRKFADGTNEGSKLALLCYVDSSPKSAVAGMIAYLICEAELKDKSIAEGEFKIWCSFIHHAVKALILSSARASYLPEVDAYCAAEVWSKAIAISLSHILGYEPRRIIASDSGSLQSRLGTDLGVNVKDGAAYPSLLMLKEKFLRSEYQFMFIPDGYQMADPLTKELTIGYKKDRFFSSLRGVLPVNFSKMKSSRATTENNNISMVSSNSNNSNDNSSTISGSSESKDGATFGLFGDSIRVSQPSNSNAPLQNADVDLRSSTLSNYNEDLRDRVFSDEFDLRATEKSSISANISEFSSHTRKSSKEVKVVPKRSSFSENNNRSYKFFPITKQCREWERRDHGSLLFENYHVDLVNLRLSCILDQLPNVPAGSYKTVCDKNLQGKSTIYTNSKQFDSKI